MRPRRPGSSSVLGLAYRRVDDVISVSTISNQFAVA